MNVNYTTEYDEYYDFTNNRGAIFTYLNYQKIKQYFLYDTLEMITIQSFFSKPFIKSQLFTKFEY
jgi:hypothetical protein